MAAHVSCACWNCLGVGTLAVMYQTIYLPAIKVSLLTPHHEDLRLNLNDIQVIIKMVIILAMQSCLSEMSPCLDLETL